jgi:hypothetical protein
MEHRLGISMAFDEQIDSMNIFMSLFAYYTTRENINPSHPNVQSLFGLDVHDCIEKYHSYYDLTRGIFGKYCSIQTDDKALVIRDPRTMKTAVYCNNKFAFTTVNHHPKLFRNPDIENELYGITIDVYDYITEAEFKEVLHI